MASKKATGEKAEFKALMATYEKQNPVKYALKKEALEAKLAALK